MDDITVKHIESIDIYDGEHAIEGIRFRPARSAMGVTAWGMNILELDPNCSNHPEHDHVKDQQEEVYLVLEGTVVLVTDGGEQTLPAHTMVRVPPNVRRKLVTRSEGATILAIGATPGQVFTPTM